MNIVKSVIESDWMFMQGSGTHEKIFRTAGFDNNWFVSIRIDPICQSPSRMLLDLSKQVERMLFDVKNLDELKPLMMLWHCITDRLKDVDYQQRMLDDISRFGRSVRL